MRAQLHRSVRRRWWHTFVRRRLPVESMQPSALWRSRDRSVRQLRDAHPCLQWRYVVRMVGLRDAGRLFAQQHANVRKRGDTGLRRQLSVGTVHRPALRRAALPSLRQLRDLESHLQQWNVVSMVDVRRGRRVQGKHDGNLRHWRDSFVRRQLSLGPLRATVPRPRHPSLRQVRHAKSCLRFEHRELEGVGPLRGRGPLYTRRNAELRRGGHADVRRYLSMAARLRRPALPRAVVPGVRAMRHTDTDLRLEYRKLVGVERVCGRRRLRAEHDARLRQRRDANLRRAVYVGRLWRPNVSRSSFGSVR